MSEHGSTMVWCPLEAGLEKGVALEQFSHCMQLLKLGPTPLPDARWVQELLC